MSADMILSLASVGVNILAAREQRGALRRQVRDTVVGGAMERYLLEQQGRQDAENRQMYLASVLGAQRAGLASAGVGGGRTERLLAAQAQAGASRAQASADQQRRLSHWASERRQTAQLAGFRTAARATELDLFAGLMDGGSDVYDAYSARKAGGG